MLPTSPSIRRRQPPISVRPCMVAARDSQPLPQSEPIAEEQYYQQEDEHNVLALKGLIIAKQEDPEPSLLHAVAAIFENVVTRYIDGTDDGRSAQNAVRQSGLIWGDEEFSRLLPSFIQNVFLVSVKVTTARLFSNCSPWMVC